MRTRAVIAILILALLAGVTVATAIRAVVTLLVYVLMAVQGGA